MNHLGGESWDPEKMDDDIAAVLACPLVRVSDGSPRATREVVAVLFADSTEGNAFNEATATEVVAACEEFGRYLQRIAKGEVSEIISVKSQATSLPEDDSAAQVFNDLSILKPSSSSAPRVAIEYLNLEWLV